MKKTYRLKITGRDLAELRQLVLEDMPKEAGAFALAGAAEHSTGIDILVRRPIAIPKPLVPFQNEFHLELASQAVNGLISLCESNGLGTVLCHSHPDFLEYSLSDDYGEGRIARTLREFIRPEAPIASLLITPEAITGRVWLPGKREPVQLSAIEVIDRSIHRTSIGRIIQNKMIDEIYDRQVRAFGKSGQALIARTKVGIVGLGGTGSPVAEQLARLGVKDLVLIDPDRFELSNLTRVYGTTAEMVKRARREVLWKVDLATANIKQIDPEIRVQAIPKSVVVDDASTALLDRDVIFLCTDDHWGRSIVNQIAYQFMIPTINLGARVTSNNGTISAAIGSMDILRPGKPCLWCKQFLKADRITTESLPRKKRQTLQQEGYVEDVNTKTPSVASITTTIAGIGVSQFLQLLTDFMGPAGDISRLTYDFLNGGTWRGMTDYKEGCICKKIQGFGTLVKLPTLPNLDYLNE